MKGRLLPTGLLLFLIALAGSGCFPEIERPTSTLPPVTVETAKVTLTPSQAQANPQAAADSCTDQNTGGEMSLTEALTVAQDSICATQGPLLGTGFCNENTGTWWLELIVEQPGCLPACVVDLNGKTAEINWRCAGASPPEETTDPGATSIPAEIAPKLDPGNVREVSYPELAISYSDLQAQGIAASSIPTATFELIEGAIIPKHDEFTFEGYVLPNTFHRPVLYVYPVQELSSGNEIAAARIGRLNQLLAEKPADPEGSLPFLPLYSAGEMMRSRFDYLSFQNGEGIRFLTQLGQSYLPINNRHLIYTFQGVTDDGKYYVAAIMPVTHPFLAADELDYPGGDPESFASNYESYANDVEGQLQTAHESTFMPDLRLLDAMVESIEFTGGASGSLPSAEVDYSGWLTYTNEFLGYTLYYPDYTTVLENGDGTSVSFEGPLENNERWPVLTVSHFDSDFYRPPEGTDVEMWVRNNGIPFDELGPVASVAGLPAFHLIVEPTPQSYGFEEIYFIRGEQLFRILLLHTGGRQDWDLYDQFLGSFVFDDQVRNLAPIAEASASSELPADRQGGYQASAAIDGNVETPWCEGATKTGVGEWVMLQFPGPVDLTEIELLNGYNKGEEEFFDHNRVKTARLVFSNGEVVWALDDGQRRQTRTLPADAGSPGIETTFVQIVIDEVYPGLAYDDTCLGEITVNGKVR